MPWQVFYVYRFHHFCNIFLTVLSQPSNSHILQRSKFLQFAVDYIGLFLDYFYLYRFLTLMAFLCWCAVKHHTNKQTKPWQKSDCCQILFSCIDVSSICSTKQVHGVQLESCGYPNWSWLFHINVPNTNCVDIRIMIVLTRHGSRHLHTGQPFSFAKPYSQYISHMMSLHTTSHNNVNSQWRCID